MILNHFRWAKLKALNTQRIRESEWVLWKQSSTQRSCLRLGERMGSALTALYQAPALAHPLFRLVQRPQRPRRYSPRAVNTAVVFLVAQLRLTLCDPMDCRSPGSSVLGILQARILEWAATSFSRGSFRLRDQTCISSTGRWILYHWGTREAQTDLEIKINKGAGGRRRRCGNEWGLGNSAVDRGWLSVRTTHTVLGLPTPLLTVTHTSRRGRSDIPGWLQTLNPSLQPSNLEANWGSGVGDEEEKVVEKI